MSRENVERVLRGFDAFARAVGAPRAVSRESPPGSPGRRSPSRCCSDVGRYFGRCLGAMATAACLQGLRVARGPQRHRSYFEFSEAAAWLLAGVNVRGLVERRQPPIEHAEILGWSAMAIAARRYAPTARRVLG